MVLLYTDDMFKPELRWDASSLAAQALDTPIISWPSSGIIPVAMAAANTGGAQLPLYEQDPRSGLPRVRTSRSSNTSANWFQAQGSITLPLPANGQHAFTLIAVVQLSSLAGRPAPSVRDRAWERILDLTNGPYSDAIFLSRYGSSDNLGYGHWLGSGNPNTSSYFVHSAPTAPMGSTAVYTARYRNGTVDMRLNGRLVEVSGAPADPLIALPRTFQQGYLGRSAFSFEQPGSLGLQEVSVFAGAVPDAELAAMSAELAAKWGLQQERGEPFMCCALPHCVQGPVLVCNLL